MKVGIYDYAGALTECELFDKEIFCIHVRIVSGDEVISVIYTDKTHQTFDSSSDRLRSFDDGDWFMYGEELDNWLKERQCS